MEKTSFHLPGNLRDLVKMIPHETSHWLKPILKDRALGRGLVLGFGISVFALVIIEVLFRLTGIYFTPICIVFSMVAALVCGFIPSIFVTILLTFSTDYLYIPPIGSILDTRAGIEHFVIIMISCITVSLLTTLLRTAMASVTKLNTELEQRGRSAIEASRLKSEFLANMSHEIRTPINGIIGMTELLKQTSLEGRQKHYTEAISSSSTLLLNLINTILDLSKVEAGRLELEILPFDLMQLLEETKNSLAPLAELRGLELRWQIRIGDERYFAGDAPRLRQIFNNLLGNAIKFTATGFVGLTVDVVKRSQLSSTVKFTVQDSGIGMSQKTMGRLFQVFTQGDASTSRKYGGSGLGLAITKQLSDLMEGELHVESVEHEGSSFSLTLTLTKISREFVQKQTTAAPVEIAASHGRRQTAKVLLAEDNLLNQEITATILRNAGYVVDVVDSGHKVLEAVANASYLAIVMDCQMPEMDGYEASKILRKSGNDIPIIALTANAFQADRERGFEAGMSEYLSKPAFADQLLPILDRYLAKVPKMPVLDPEALERLREVDDEGVLLKTLLQMYADRIHDGLDELRASLVGGQHEVIRKSAHVLRSSNLNIGAHRVGSILSTIEERAMKQQTIPEAEYLDMLAKLQIEIQAAHDALAVYVRDHSSRKP